MINKKNKNKKKENTKNNPDNKNIKNSFVFNFPNTTDNNNNLLTSNNNFLSRNKRNLKEDDKNKNIVNQNIAQRAINIMKYKDEEMNKLPYDLEIKNDKRSYCDYYISLLRTKHDLIFSFCGSEDYNSKIIKIDLFIIGFTIYYTVNALFYNDNTMHNIYENKGSFVFIYQLPKNIYSSIISLILNAILKALALSNSRIISMKKDKFIKDIKERGNSVERCLKIKFIFYFIISFILLVLFWYYLSMFGAIYKNTQIHLLKDTLISFVLSLITPFVIYLLPGLFRIPALHDSQNERKYLYGFSKFLQFF